jgi:hypothetical protein
MKINHLFISVAIVAALALPTISCSKKKEEPTTSTNIASTVVSNLTTVSNNYTPNSLDKATTRDMQIQSDPCAGVTDFAVCQSNLIREYLQIGKSMVDLISQLANSVGSALVNLADGSSGQSNDGLISWKKTDSSNWSILVKGTNNQSVAYFKIAGGVYTLKIDNNNAS